MFARRMINAHVVLLLGFACLVAGCAALTAPVESNILPATSKAYDLPGDVDPNVITKVLEDSFLRVLKVSPTITEGAMPPQIPLTPSGFLVEYKMLTLDHLGAVRFPHVVCPHSLTMIEGVHGDFQAVYRYTACLQPFRDGYRVHLVETPGALTQDGPALSPSVSTSDVLIQLADRMTKGLPLARVASTFQRAATFESAELPRETRTATQDSIEAARQPSTFRAVQSNEGEPKVEAISPLVCLALERNEVVVRAAPGEGRVIGTLTSELALGENTPLDGAYVRIRTEQGLAGWVQKSDLHWSACPIG
ncbi:MAG TPA: hypothetical protein PLZ37_15700 [Nitrospira sp.]|nr:hypothetical protein [Nitrospira sp.]